MLGRKISIFYTDRKYIHTILKNIERLEACKVTKSSIAIQYNK